MRIESKSAVLPLENIDTDQIIPARFLTTTERKGLGKHAFADWRYEESGAKRADFVLNQPEFADAKILIAGKNFGCGSSREHAPWALLDAGIHAVISSEIADIFRSNALKNGLIACVIDAAAHQYLLQHPGITIAVDVAAAQVQFAGQSYGFAIDPFTQHCLLNGVDSLGFILQQQAAIARFEAQAAL
jgi:3-isopropylmalate/(R)-2-methylmalate dehydratase small subunit